jgi:hypothetical protein
MDHNVKELRRSSIAIALAHGTSTNYSVFAGRNLFFDAIRERYTGILMTIEFACAQRDHACLRNVSRLQVAG